MSKSILFATAFYSLLSTAPIQAVQSPQKSTDNCPYFEANTCLSDARLALETRLSTLQGGQFRLGKPTTFCGALDNADTETILYKYHYPKVEGPKGLKLKAQIEITLNMDECVSPIVTILN